MLVRVLTLVLAALLLAGCDGGDDEAPAITAATTGAATTDTTTSTGLQGASTEPVSWDGEANETALLTAVRAASHDGHDRVVFEFANVLPGYDVGYAERPIVQDGSGEEIDVAGGAVLVVRMEPALDADLTKESAPPTYTGPTRFSPEADAIVELVRTGGFEAVLTWAVGVDDERPFRVTRLEGPPRIVIDVAVP